MTEQIKIDFEKTIKTYSNINKCLDMIDIGGHALLRSAAKNFHSITAISKLFDYDDFIKNMTKNWSLISN